ncbi:MAG: hypothetical protein ACYCS7_03455 [Acidimicrobiales bacterium]
MDHNWNLGQKVRPQQRGLPKQRLYQVFRLSKERQEAASASTPSPIVGPAGALATRPSRA